jgi:hypothetical protein
MELGGQGRHGVPLLTAIVAGPHCDTDKGPCGAVDMSGGLPSAVCRPDAPAAAGRVVDDDPR